MLSHLHSFNLLLKYSKKWNDVWRAGLGRSRNGSTSARGTISGPIRLELRDLARRMKRKNALRYTDLQLTRSLLVITTVFIALNLPNYAYRIGIQFFHISDNVRKLLMNFSLSKCHINFLKFQFIDKLDAMSELCRPCVLIHTPRHSLLHVHLQQSTNA